MKKQYSILLSLATVILLTGVLAVAQKNVSNSPSEESYKLSLVKTSPVYPGCTGTEFEIRKCLSESLANHFKKSINSELIKDIATKEKEKFIAAMFDINKEGRISNVKVVPENESLVNEMNRVFDLLPIIDPGIRKNEKVNVKYHIHMTLNEDEMTIESKPTHY